MSAFSNDHIRKLAGKLDRKHVRTRRMDDREVDYIEGWYAISEANAIFGFGGWDREMTHFERVFERTRGDLVTCAYLARVQIRVKAGSRVVQREGTGWGAASSRSPGDAHERAIKSAETDATKRALATFGDRFGLGLYDKDQAGVTPKRNTFVIHDPRGEVLAANLSPEGFCSGLRQIIENRENKCLLQAWHTANGHEIARLRLAAPELKNAKGEHFPDLLGRLFQSRLALPVLAAPADVGRSKPSGSSGAGSPTDTAAARSNGNGVSVANGAEAPGTEAVAAATQSVSAHATAQLDDVSIANPTPAPDSKAVVVPPTSASTHAVAQGESFAANEAPATGQTDRESPVQPETRASKDGTEVVTSAHRQRSDERSGKLEAGAHVGAHGRSSSASSRSQYLPLKPSRIAYGARIDKAALAIAAPPRRLRDKRHLRHVGTLPCLICKEAPSHPHHLTFAQARGLAVKVSDEFVVPLCAVHHNDLHRSGNESLWWQRLGIEPLGVAKALWDARANTVQSEAGSSPI